MELTQDTKATQTPEDKELQDLYQEYLQKCCEVGQLRYNLDQIEGQKRDMEKNLEVTERAVKGVAHKHRELQKDHFSKLKSVQEPAKLELNKELAN